jgi:ParB family transcriptional regulator, chromosome partitioning protein
MATKKTVESPEFLYLPLGSIIVEEQIRSAVDTTSESFKALMSSIKDKGVLEPVLVTQKDDKYLLLCGERRYLAAQKLGMEIIPARIVNTVTQKDEILAIQLTENLQREDLNPIDQAKGILAYIQAKHPDKGYNLDGVMSELVRYNRKPETLPKEIVTTIVTISEISAKSINTLYNTISLLKLVPKIQDVIFSGKLPVSQGYLFAANLGSPDFFTIFDEIMETPVTNAVLEKKLTAYKRRKPESTDPKPIPMKIKVASIEAAKTYFEEKAGMYPKSDLQTFLDELKVLSSLIEQQIKTAPESVPVKQTDKKPVPQL